MAPPSNLTLKLVVDKNNQRVLFAEAGKDFVDFLFSLLALPVSTVISLLDNRNMISGLCNLYQSVSDLNNDYIQSNQNKDVLLKPKITLPYSSPHVPLLCEALSVSSPSVPFYSCSYCKNGMVSNSSRGCPYTYCGRLMTPIVDDRFNGGFVKGVTYMVTDDLAVSPMSTIMLLSKFNIKDMGALEEKVVQIGMDEGLELLKRSLNSKTVLTDVFLGEVVVKEEGDRKRSKCYGK